MNSWCGNKGPGQLSLEESYWRCEGTNVQLTCFLLFIGIYVVDDDVDYIVWNIMFSCILCNGQVRLAMLLKLAVVVCNTILSAVQEC